jgi:beta-aspartyl-peptidase (threonine type)
MSAVLVVHGGAGAPSEAEWAERQAAVERALEAGWYRIGAGALDAAQAAIRHMEDEALLNAGIGACLNSDGEVELDAGLMEGTALRTGAAGAVRDVRHPIDLARAVLEDGRHVLLVAEGASRFARSRGVETCDPAVFITDRQRQRLAEQGDTVGAVARDSEGRLAVAVSTGGRVGKLPGRVGDSPLPGAGFYANDLMGAACGTGLGEGFMRLVLCHLAVIELGHGYSALAAARGAVDHLQRNTGVLGGIIVVDAKGEIAAAHTTAFMPWAQRVG